MMRFRVAALAAVLSTSAAYADADGGTLLPSVWVPLPTDADAPATPQRR